MDGATLLRHVQQRFPSVVRIVLSGHTELEAAFRAVPIAHQFLSKPCKADCLKQVLERACQLQTLMDDERVRAVIGGVVDLPARPEVFAKLSATLAKEDSSVAEVAQIVERDLGISSKILRVVNSAFFGAGTPVKTVQAAVMRLGTAMIRDLVLSVEIFKDADLVAATGFSAEALHTHALAVGRIAKEIVGNGRMGEDAFLAGLLHDCGQLICASRMPDQFRQVGAAMTQSGRPRDELEYEMNGSRTPRSARICSESGVSHIQSWRRSRTITRRSGCLAEGSTWRPHWPKGSFESRLTMRTA